jgi:hypothetical protein
MLKLESFLGQFCGLGLLDWNLIVTNFTLTPKFVYNQKLVLNRKGSSYVGCYL